MKSKTICLALIFIITISACREKSPDMPGAISNSDNIEQVNNFDPEEWHFESQRDELAPIYELNNDLVYRNNPTLTLSGGGKEHANGCWFNIVDIIPGRYYRFRVHYKASRVEEPRRSVLARIIWMDENNKQVGRTEYPKTLRNQTPEKWDIIEQIYKIPADARRARMELIYRWDANGIVHFGDFSFVEVDEPAARKVRLATVYHRPRGCESSQDNLEQFAGLIEEAGAGKADIICLPEFITLVGTGHNYLSAAEPVPGPTTRFLGEIAKKHNLYIVAGIGEKEGNIVYNTAVLIDRKGDLAGRYRKVSLPREEIEGGVTPGDSIPVFDTDFGRIGLMICWDVTFPEVARTLAMRGAEVILMPIWGGNLILAQARAIENQVYMVSSTYDMKSAIFDMEGRMLDEATEQNPVVISEVDLNEQILWPWLGDFKNRIPREIPSKKVVEQHLR